MKQNLKKKTVAFTLAEVLITLGIIGIVSALTIPTLIKNYQEKVRDNQFKKVYATLNQALRMTISDFDYTVNCYYDEKGALNNTDCKTFWETFESKMKVVKSCSSNSFAKGCIPDYKGYEYDVKERYKNDPDYDEEYWDNYVNSQWSGLATNHLKTRAQSFDLADGTIVIRYGHSGYVTPMFIVDINGFAGPNRFNQDLQVLRFQYKNNKFLLTGHSSFYSTTLITKLFGIKGH